MEYEVIYADSDIRLSERIDWLQDSTDQARTIVLNIDGKDFYFQVVFGKLIGQWQK